MARKTTERDDDRHRKSVPAIGKRLICADLRPIVMTSRQEWVSLKQQIERGRKALDEAATNTGDLEETIQGLQRTRQSIFEKRNQRMKNKFI